MLNFYSAVMKSYRKTLVQERASEINRLQKVLESANLKLAAVATDILDKNRRHLLVQ